MDKEIFFVKYSFSDWQLVHSEVKNVVYFWHCGYETTKRFFS